MHQIQLLKKYGLKVTGARGQHLLIDENIQRKLVSLVDPKKGETLIEIGPGLGAITELLLKSCARVIAIEREERFVEILRGELGGDFKNLTLVSGDILKIDLKKFAKTKPFALRVVGNIPYYITSPLLLRLIQCRQWIDSAYLTVQKEIADRLFAQPGSKAYGRLSLLVRFYAETRRLFEISRNCFSPKPDVDSSVVELVFRRTLPNTFDDAVLFEVIKAGFSERRKKILNAIANAFQEKMSKKKVSALLTAAQIPLSARAEELMLKDFIRLAEEYRAIGLPPTASLPALTRFPSCVTIPLFHKELGDDWKNQY
jgi:16S rRNA (adenine1518-N6/adenine1519-N6)-dimethyltransferase